MEGFWDLIVGLSTDRYCLNFGLKLVDWEKFSLAFLLLILWLG